VQARVGKTHVWGTCFSRLYTLATAYRSLLQKPDISYWFGTSPGAQIFPPRFVTCAFLVRCTRLCKSVTFSHQPKIVALFISFFLRIALGLRIPSWDFVLTIRNKRARKQVFAGTLEPAQGHIYPPRPCIWQKNNPLLARFLASHAPTHLQTSRSIAASSGCVEGAPSSTLRRSWYMFLQVVCSVRGVESRICDRNRYICPTLAPPLHPSL
jgi:hypothetical protein